MARELVFPRDAIEATPTLALAETLKVQQNPTLSLFEKTYARLVCRNTRLVRLPDGSFSLANQEDLNLLQSLVYQDGEKLDFEVVMDFLNPKRTKEEICKQILRCQANPLVVPSHTYAGFSLRALRATYIQDVAQGSLHTNCLETSLVLALIAKLFYKDERVEVYPMGFTQTSDIGESRHIMFFWSRGVNQDRKFFITRFEGSTHPISVRLLERLYGAAKKETFKNIATQAYTMLGWTDSNS